MNKTEKQPETPQVREHSVSGCLFSFMYNSCIHKGSSVTVSLHYSREGAEKAMNEHKQKELEDFNELIGSDNKFDMKFGEHEDWSIGEVFVLP